MRASTTALSEPCVDWFGEERVCVGKNGYVLAKEGGKKVPNTGVLHKNEHRRVTENKRASACVLLHVNTYSILPSAREVRKIEHAIER